LGFNVKVFTENMARVLERVYSAGGRLRVKSLRVLGVNTVKALERRKLINVTYDKVRKVWLIEATGRGLRVARRIGGS